MSVSVLLRSYSIVKKKRRPPIPPLFWARCIGYYYCRFYLFTVVFKETTYSVTNRKNMKNFIQSRFILLVYRVYRWNKDDFLDVRFYWNRSSHRIPGKRHYINKKQKKKKNCFKCVKKVLSGVR